MTPSDIPSLPIETFAPPSGYRFEPELQGTTPRHVPEEFRDSPFYARQRNTTVALLAAGALCAAFGQLHIVREWGLYLLPLNYLGWIGLGLLVLGAVGWISGKMRPGPIEYVQEGVPLVARIRELVLRPTTIMNGQPTTYAFSAMIEYRHPDTGEIVAKQVDSRGFSASAKNKYRTSYRVGDYATLVYLKSKPDKTLQLYGFLELRPDIGLLASNVTQAPSVLKTLLGVSALFAFFAALIWNLYAISKYSPLEVTFSVAAVPVTVGGLILGGGTIAWLASRQARSRRELAARNEKALAAGEAVELEPSKRGLFGSHGLLLTIVIGFGLLMLGGAIVLCCCFTANSLLDHSNPEYRQVEIVEFWSTTHSFLFREYEIEYRLPGEEKTRKLLSTPSQMRQLRSRFGTAEIHGGRFGWPWVKDILPTRGPAEFNSAP